jgi:hypothetical protein
VRYPTDRFDNQEEFDAHCACMRKISLGDKVSLWLTDDGYISNNKHNHAKDSIPIDVIGIRPNTGIVWASPFPIILVGTRVANYRLDEYTRSLWVFHPNLIKEDYQYMTVCSDFAEYKRCYWLFESDARVAKIYRKSSLIH